jgi:hypothetical protein
LEDVKQDIIFIQFHEDAYIRVPNGNITGIAESAEIAFRKHLGSSKKILQRPFQPKQPTHKLVGKYHYKIRL